MRRDDTKKLIAALIRRRHDDSLRIKKLRSRLNDGPAYCFRDEYLSAPINRIVRKLRDDLIDLGHNPNKSHIMKAISRFEKSVWDCDQHNIGDTMKGVQNIKDEFTSLNLWGKLIKNNSTKQIFEKYLDKLKHETFLFINRIIDRDKAPM